MTMEEEQVFKERKEKAINYLKTNYNIVSYIILAVIVFIATRIRTRNLSGLRDITTGAWTLGPDLDPFFFLRWAKYIIEHGSLMAVDMMRCVPLGFQTSKEYLLHPYLIAWFHKFASFFGSTSVEQSAALYPVFMFALTVVAFFLLTRKIFVDILGKRNSNMIALISSFFLSVLPVILPRTIAGIPEKESSSFLFMFLAFYFFLSAWKSETKKSRYIFAALSGVASAAMALIWGGFVFLFIPLSFAVFVAFLFGKINREKTYTYAIWVLSSFILMMPFSPRYSIINLLESINTFPAIFVLLLLIVHSLIFSTKLKNYIRPPGPLTKISSYVFSVLATVIIGIIGSTLIFGPSFIIRIINIVIDNLITPATSRLIQTVAENRQPFFTEWARNFGPLIKGTPLFFWLFFTGSIYLFYKMIRSFNKKDRILLTFSYIIFLIFMVFSRYSSESIFNGTSGISLLVYAAGFIIFILAIGYYYNKYYKTDNFDKIRNIDFGLILIFSLFFLSIIAARGAVRVIMLLVPPTSIIVSYFVVSSIKDVRKIQDETMKIIGLVLIAIVVISAVYSGFYFYRASSSTAEGYVPSVYNQQWQKAMSWVRTNTPEDAVFGHWWDYGYWVQTIGERATILDGGNALSYWNHLMGRYALTGTSSKEAAEFLYAHDATHFLIDSTDVGKYGAYAKIGSDVNYDRASFIPTFLKDSKRTQETKNSTVSLYLGGVTLDEDIIYEDNGTRIFLPAGKAGIGGVLIETDNSGNIIGQPQGLYIYQGTQYNLPLRYYFNGELTDFGSGIESGVFMVPVLEGSSSIDKKGALLLLSKRTVNSQFARLYLYGGEDEYFKLAHSEEDFLISQIRAQGIEVGDFIIYGGFRGPVKIWEVNYPGITLKQEYLETKYPEELKFA